MKTSVGVLSREGFDVCMDLEAYTAVGKAGGAPALRTPAKLPLVSSAVCSTGVVSSQDHYFLFLWSSQCAGGNKLIIKVQHAECRGGTEEGAPPVKSYICHRRVPTYLSADAAGE